jgi:hypothetical protein
LASFLEQCEDNGTDPIECFITILKTFMTNHGYLKEEKKTVVAARKAEASSLEARLEEPAGRRQGRDHRDRPAAHRGTAGDHKDARAESLPNLSESSGRASGRSPRASLFLYIRHEEDYG